MSVFHTITIQCLADYSTEAARARPANQYADLPSCWAFLLRGFFSFIHHVQLACNKNAKKREEKTIHQHSAFVMEETNTLLEEKREKSTHTHIQTHAKIKHSTTEWYKEPAELLHEMVQT